MPIATAMLIALSAVLAAAAGALAQGARTAQVGVLALSSETGSLTGAAVSFREGLRELGWTEGQNVGLRLRFANVSQEQLSRMANELVQDRVDVIVALGTDASLAARRATTTIPIVMAGVGDPIRTGLVTNLARPGGNITGVSLILLELGGKRLELLRQIVPGLSRAAHLHLEGAGPSDSLRAEALRLGVGLQRFVFQGPATAADRFSEMRAAGAQAVIIGSNPVIDEARGMLAELALKHRLPTMCNLREYVEAGALVSYGPDLGIQQRRAARYVDLILKGARPGDLLIEQPSQLELVVNRRTAKALALTIPPTVLLRADRVIE
jgi:putative ABC transport system substrate-binding protein